MPYYQVTFEYHSGSTQNDIALKEDTLADAKWYVQHRIDQLEVESRPKAFTLKRISKAAAEAIVDDNGIDWIH